MNDRQSKSIQVTIQSIILNILLTTLKILAGIIGKSQSIIADGLHSASDVITSIGVLLGNHFANIPKDKEHNYGHEKIETMTSFILSIVLILAALLIGFNSIELLLNKHEVSIPTLFPLIIAGISIITKEIQYQITIKVAKELNSPMLKADAWHHRSDALSSIAALIGIGGAILGLPILEPIASVVVALFVAKVGYDILHSSFNELIDCSIGHELEESIKNSVLEYDKVFNIRDMKSRKHGARAYIDITIEIDGDKTIHEGHIIAHEIEDLLKDKFEILKGVNVHIEPHTKECCS